VGAVSYAIFYAPSLVPGGVFLGALALLLVVPVFALAALAAALLVAIGILVVLAGTAVAMPVLLARLALRHWPPRLASWPMRTRGGPREPRSMRFAQRPVGRLDDWLERK
jgi:hypothetical protein